MGRELRRCAAANGSCTCRTATRAPTRRQRRQGRRVRQQEDRSGLFDLENDIGETTNLADKYPDLVKHLESLLENAGNALGDGKRAGKNVRPAGEVESE